MARRNELITGMGPAATETGPGAPQFTMTNQPPIAGIDTSQIQAPPGAPAFTMPVMTDTDTQPTERDRLQATTEQRIMDILNEEWTEPLRERQTEMAARTAMQMRGAAAQRVGEAGLTGQGIGVQAMEGVEQDIREMVADNTMLTAMAEQEATERGIGYAQNLLWFRENQKKYEDADWWKEFTYLMQVDPERAGELYTDQTGRPIDTTAIQGSIERADIATIRSTARTIMADMALDPNNADVAFTSTKDYLKKEIAFDTGREPEEITDDEARTYFDALWEPTVASPSTRLYNDLANTPELAGYFDTQAERDIVASWAVKTVYGGLDEDGNIKEGWPLPWEDPESKHWFVDLVSGLETEPDAAADPTAPLPQDVQITRNGQTINVSQDSVRKAFDSWADQQNETNPEFFVDTDTFGEWFKHYKNDTLAQYDPMAKIHSEGWPEDLNTAQSVEGNEKLVSGTGTTATVNQTLTDYIPRILDSIENDTHDQLYPDMYAGVYGDTVAGTVPQDGTDMSVFWTYEGFRAEGGKGQRRAILSDAGKTFISENRGKIIHAQFEGMEGPEYFIVLDQLDDGQKDDDIQKIKLRNAVTGDEIYIGRPLVIDNRKKPEAKIHIMPSGDTGDSGPYASYYGD
jgi:hypothetical protein